MIKIGIMSFEHMHAFSYAQALNESARAELVGIFDEDEYRGTDMAYRLQTTYYGSQEEFFSQEMDGVIVCSNNRDHPKFVATAAEAGKHILVEKPFAINLKAAENMIDVAQKNSVKLMNALPMRFNSNIIEAKKMIEDGQIGDILSITSINHGKIPSGWFLDQALAGGGGVMDHTVHLADIIRWLTNSEYVTVYCESGTLIHNKGIDDCGIVFAELENEVFTTIDCSWAHHLNYPIWPQVDLEIIGTKGVLNVQAFAQVNHIVNAEKQVVEDILWNPNGDALLIEEFISVCQGSELKYPTAIDGAKATELAVAAYESSAKKEAVQVTHIHEVF